MVKLYIAVVCITSFASAQTQPRLHRLDGTAAPTTAGNLAGFKPVQRIWPSFSAIDPNPPDGVLVSVSMRIADGKPTYIQVLEGLRRFTKPVLDALQQWRFDMPIDGTSPVNMEITFNCQHGTITPDVEVHLPSIEHDPPLKVLHRKDPGYPDEALKAGIEGAVECLADVNQYGTVDDVEVIRGPQLLRASVVNALREWRFKPDPTLPRQIRVEFNFR